MPKLVYHDSDGVEKVLALGNDQIMIGRAPECQIQTQDAMVSRRHARIVWDGNYWIEDLGSSNGVYVGNERVQRAPFRPGDTVTCGSLVLRLLPDARNVSPAARAPTVPPAGDDFDDLPMRGEPPGGMDEPGQQAPTTEYRDRSKELERDLAREKQRRAESEEAVLQAAERIKQVEQRAAMAEQQADVSERRAHAAEERAREAETRLREVEQRLAELQAQAKEAAALKRRVEQLTAELKTSKRGPTEEEVTHDEGERQVRRALELEKEQLKQQVADLQRKVQAAAAGGQHAGPVDAQVGDTAVLLGDALASLRASLRAATGEVALISAPAESTQVMMENLKTAAEQLESARGQLRTLAKLLGL